MKILRLNLVLQTSLGLIIALIMGLLIQSVLIHPVSTILPSPPDILIYTSTPIPGITHTTTQLPTLIQTETLVPSYKNINHVYSVTVILYRDKPPEILEIANLTEGRLVVTIPGNSIIELLNSSNEVVYSQSFTSIFLSGEPMVVVEQLTKNFILPADLGGVKVRIITPQGEVEHEFPANQ